MEVPTSEARLLRSILCTIGIVKFSIGFYQYRAFSWRSEAPFLLSPDSETRGASPGANQGDSVWMQAIVFGNRLGSPRARNQRMQESVRWMLQRVPEPGALRGDLRGERVSGQTGGVRVVREGGRSEV